MWANIQLYIAMANCKYTPTFELVLYLRTMYARIAGVDFFQSRRGLGVDTGGNLHG